MGKEGRTKIIFKILIVIQLCFAVTYILLNLGYLPGYGDTPEYLELAKTMALDAYRPFLFPLFLRACTDLSQFLNINYLWIVYLFQLILSFAAAFLVTDTFADVLLPVLDRKDRWFLTLFLWSLPFNIHFNMTVLSDSLAISLSLFFICSLIRFLKKPDSLQVLILIIETFLVSNSRSEKLYFCLFTILGVVLLLVILKAFTSKKVNNFKLIVLGLVVVVVVSLPLNLLVKNFLQKDLPGREPPSVSSLLFERIVADNLPEYYEQLPEDLKRDIPYETAQRTTESANFYKDIYTDLERLDGNHVRANRLTALIFKLDFSNLFIEIFNDYEKNLFPSYYELFDSDSDGIHWTRTRMQGDHMHLTDFYILYYMAFYVLINVVLILKILNRNNRLNLNHFVLLSPAWFYALVSASFFSLLSSQNFNIRYVMPVYLIQILLPLLLLFGSFKGSKTKENPVN